MTTEISNYISNDYKAIDCQETVADVQSFFEETSFSHFPILESEIYIGCLASDLVENFETNKKIIDYRFSLEGFFAKNEMNWLDVLEIFAKNNTDIVPVLNEQNKYLGYYEISDVYNLFNETPFLNEQGRVIVLKKNEAEYSTSQIGQIVESNNGKLLGLIISATNGLELEITLKIGTGPINEIIQAFRRYDYEIVSGNTDDHYLNILKENSDYLDKYLNI